MLLVVWLLHLAAMAQGVMSSPDGDAAIAYVRKMLDTGSVDFIDESSAGPPATNATARQYGAANVPFTMSQVTSFTTSST